MKKRVFKVFAVLVLTIMTFQANAQLSKFKALYIYNVSRYIEWPSGYGSDVFKIGIVGNDPDLISNLKAISSSKFLNGKKIEVVKVSSAAEASQYNVLYFTSGKEGEISNYTSSAKSCLIITDKQGATNQGAGINFYAEGNKLQFELKVSNVSANGLKVSNELKSLATRML